MKFFPILSIPLLLLFIIGCSSLNETGSQKTHSNDDDVLVELMINYFENDSDTLVIFFPGFSSFGTSVLNSSGALLNKDYEFPIEEKYMQLVFRQISKTNFMNITDSILSQPESSDDEYFIMLDWNYLIVKLGKRVNYIRYKPGQLNNQFELKKLELFTRIICQYASGKAHKSTLKLLLQSD